MGWNGALITLEKRAKVKEEEERKVREKKDLLAKMQEKYIQTRPCPIQKPSMGCSIRTENQVRIKQDRGPALTNRTRGNAHPQYTHSASLAAKSILGIAYSSTARSMDAIKGADMLDMHPWKLLALCRSRDAMVNIAAIQAVNELGRDKMCAALAGGYHELMDIIMSGARDQDAKIRAAFVQALGNLAMTSDPQAIEELTVATQDADDYVRVSALGSLAKITPREASLDRCRTHAVQTVLARVRDGDPDVREAALRALASLAPIGNKLAVEVMLQGLDEPSSTLNDAAIDGLILLGDVRELVEGENQLLEVAVTNVRLCVAEGASKGEFAVAAASNLVGRDQQKKKASGGCHEADWRPKGESSGEGRASGGGGARVEQGGEAAKGGSGGALQYWVTLFGIQDFVVRISGCVQDGSGRTKLLALVEDSLTLIEGDIETNGRLVFWWPPGNRRVLFQTSGQWAWEYRKQCVYCGGYLYIDAETGEELFGSDLSFEKYFFVETEEEGLWNILFLRGVRGGLRTELGRFQTPVVYEYPLVEHTDAVHEHTDAVHDAAVEASSCQRMNYTSAAETQTEGLLRCAEAIELDTDVVAGKGLVVIRLTQQPAQRNENEKETKTQQAAQSASAPRTNQMWTIFAMPHGHAEGAMQIAALSLQPPPPPRTLTLIDAEAGLGSRNHKQVEATLAAPPTQPHLFSGNDMFPCLGVLSLRMRSSNVEQRIVGGVLARLENECLQVRAAAVHTLKVYVGIGNTEAILGVLARLRHPQLSVRAAAADALPFVAHRGDQLAVQGCLGCMLSEAWWVRASALEAFRTICGSRDAEAMQLIEAFETEVCPDRSRTEQPTDMARVKELVAGLQRVEAAARKEKK